MRLHQLEATAFGPFAQTVTVDFDALSEAGLFLLSGATGSGKTSVLDAVCFALYGDVPGDRAAAKRLRCDQAAPGLVPRVTLECTLAGRRFRLTRTPAWERPKKRGTGTTMQHASVVATERIDGEWRTLSTRLDETGYLVASLIGMTLAQFTQVAMLPQGRFQAFLRARSEDRHRLLQRLFRTSRFEDIEKWLRVRRQALGAEARRHQETLADLVSRLSEVATDPAPDLESDLAAAAEEVVAWAKARCVAARRAAESAAQRRDEAAARDDQARTHLTEAESLAEHQHRHRAATEQLAGLLAEHSTHEELRGCLDLARRAAPVPPLQAAYDAAAEAAAEAAAQVARAEAAAERHPVPDGVGWEAAQTRAHETAAAAVALLPAAERIVELDAQLESTDERLALLESETSAAETTLATIPPRIARLREDVREAEHAESLVATQLLEVERAEERLAAAERAVLLRADLLDARASAQAAVDDLQRRKETWLDLQQARITGMAAELAGRIAVGDDCPVCGSTDHPHLATPAPEAPDDVAEREARRRVDDAEVTRHAHDERVQTVSTQLELARHASGGAAPEEATAELGRRRERLVTLRARAATLAARGSALAEAERALEQSRSHRQSAGTLAATLTAEREAATVELARHRRRVAELMGGADCRDLVEFLDTQRAAAAAYGAVLTAHRERALAENASLAAADRVTRAALEAGFEDAATALEAAWDATQVAEAEHALQRYDVALESARLSCADPDLVAAADLAAPDLPPLRAAVAAAAVDRRQRDRQAATAHERAVRLQQLADEVEGAVAAFTPLRQELELASSLSAFVDGRSPDNQLQMRLSAYVVAHRLSQVIAAANERLGGMSDRRYTLEHSGRRGAGETRGGLSMLVRDDWSGETRDPATLSGGESFVVALALALGLSDVITQEAGGADLDTLFVDEGFGALDAETLDDVLDTLDSLRDGGRVVGVVSHVPEMRDRIPTRLAVLKHRDGSTVRLEHTG